MLEKTLKSPLDCKKITSVNPKYSLEGLMLKLKLQYYGYLMWRADSLEKTLIKGKTDIRRRRGHHWLRGYEFEQTLGDGEEQGSLAHCSPWGHKESDDLATEQQQQCRIGWSLYLEDHTFRRAKCVGHSYWAYALQPRNCNYWARVP